MARNKADTVGAVTQEQSSALGAQMQEQEGAGDVLTLQQLRGMDDEAFRDLLDRAQGHSKDFQKYFNANFSYSCLNTEAKRRGFKNGWYREKDVESATKFYALRPSGEKTKRQTFSVSESVHTRWAAFSEVFPYKSLLIDTALTRLMDDVENDRVGFKAWMK